MQIVASMNDTVRPVMIDHSWELSQASIMICKAGGRFLAT
jgi:hypothetical protein